MDASETFKNIIENFLKEKAVNDTAFSLAFAKPSKNLEQCIKHIISEVKKTGLNVFADNEIFDIAVQYYIDDTITSPAEIKCDITVNKPPLADLFSTPFETAQKVVDKTPVKEIPKTVQTALTLFDL
ncbi:Cas9 inhibitor AcrIIA9 family protein [Flavobacterium aquiphilum]|uniref:Cas9 inhibitor AcrIIA9 family protein n=1 Tax=Flavobacterium aquiphilum TaxID=3003261 RepID=UPI0024817929|nr:Cas9 inhibitor AcrIIA9 family protein [Flavobacterium aquiphilum]